MGLILFIPCEKGALGYNIWASVEFLLWREKMEERKPLCHACGSLVDLEVKIGRRDTCETCIADLHCCMNCRFYDVNADLCRENIMAYIKYRAQSNFCAAFEFKLTGPDQSDVVNDAKAKLSELFKNL